MDIQKLLAELTNQGVISGIEFEQGTRTQYVQNANDRYWYLRNHSPLSEGEVSLAVAEELAKRFGIQVAWFRRQSGPHESEKVPYFAWEFNYEADGEEAVLAGCRGIFRARNTFDDARRAALTAVARIGIGEVLNVAEGFEILPGLVSLGWEVPRYGSKVTDSKRPSGNCRTAFLFSKIKHNNILSLGNRRKGAKMRDDPLHYIGQVLAHLGHDLVVSVTEVEGETILYLSQPLTTELTPHLRLIASGHTVHWRKLPALGEGNFCTVGLTSGESQDRDCIARAARVLEGAGVDICRALAPNLAATA